MMFILICSFRIVVMSLKMKQEHFCSLVITSYRSIFDQHTRYTLEYRGKFALSNKFCGAPMSSIDGASPFPKQTWYRLPNSLLYQRICWIKQVFLYIPTYIVSFGQNSIIAISIKNFNSYLDELEVRRINSFELSPNCMISPSCNL